MSMPAKSVPPSLGTASFSCPHCGTLTHQFWFKLYAGLYSEEESPPSMPYLDALDRIASNKTLDETKKQKIASYAEKLLSRKPFFETGEDTAYLRTQADNIFLNPATVYAIEPNPDLPPDVKADFEEASKIVNLSPRGAAALLRLSIETLCATLEPNKPLKEAIGILVKKGLSVQIQQALDIVRVVGNNAVHPGQIDLKDDRATAVQLFALVNLIAEQMISQPKHVKAMFDNLPEEQRQQIEERDKPSDTK